CGCFISWQLGHFASVGFARWSCARLVLVLLFEWRRFGFGIALLLFCCALTSCKSVDQTHVGADCMGFSPQKLLFFQPVLLDACQRRQPRISRVRFAAALLVIQVRSACRA